MGLARSLARQLAEPRGLAGALCGAAMDVANRAPLKMAVDLLRPDFGETVLDAGCGTGAASVEILRRAACRIIAVDQSATMIRRAQARMAKIGGGDSVSLHRATLENLPCDIASIDAALALNILYFCDEESRMIASMRKALRPGGRLAAYVTHRRTMEKWSFTKEGYHRLYDEEELRNALVKGGFDPAHISIGSRSVGAGVEGLFALAHAA